MLVLFLSRVFFFGVAWLGLQVNTEQSVKPHPDAFSQSQVWSSFIRWDSYHLYDVAVRGYQSDALYRTAFFPLYPVLSRVIGNAWQNVWVAGLLVSYLSFFIGGVLSYLIARNFLQKRDALFALVLISFFPAAFFYSAWYTESLFFCVSAAALLAHLRHHRWLAIFFAVLALFARPVGVGLVATLCIIEIVAWVKRRRITLGDVLWIASVFIASTLLILFYYIVSGDGFAFLHSQGWWGHRLSDPITSMLRSAYALITQADIFGRGELLIATLLSIPTLLFALWGLREKRIPFALTLYSFFVVLLPMLGGHLYSFTRYILLAFPLAYFAALKIQSAWIRSLLLFLLLFFGGLTTFAFTHWQWAG
ncbi:MAG: hypothetical protein H6760_04445 [Candidatus Nomurabacteria bacterium]|nr:MAG: hypothetical protein H6760_04445 [Candidatus Nomurabacteria bacterium]